MTTGDTIAAISSAVGAAPRMIVRVSGPDALRLAELLSENLPNDFTGATQITLKFADLKFPATFYVFRAPHSYAGEHLVEFHIPGNPLLARMLLDALIERGARQADAGEFTARAYFNGKIDLTEAEGVAAAVSAGSEQELRAARQLLAGELARRLRPAIDLIAETLALVEVGIDFSDEDVTFLSSVDVIERVDRADAMLRELVDNSTRFEKLTHEPKVVLVGKPNAGKSTVLNALAGRDRAVTSAVAGTTRDVLSVDVVLRRGIIKLLDVAGIEDGHGGAEHFSLSPRERVGVRAAETSNGARRSSRPHPSPLPEGEGTRGIEHQMRERALRAVETADVVVLVKETVDDTPDIELSRPPDLVVRSKSDLATSSGDWNVSAKTGENLDRLREELDRLAFGETAEAGPASLALNARHVRAVSDARGALARVKNNTARGEGAEILALDLRESLDALGGVVGMVTPDELLGRIFSAFCIGK